LGSILAGGYSLLCSPRYPIVMADGKVPIRELASNQVRGHLEVVLAVGTSVQIDNFKNKRADVSRLVNLQSALENSIIEASLDGEVEEEEIVESEVEIIEEKPEPIGISCLISIDRCSNTNIRQHSKLRVTLDTLNGPVSTDWSGSGNFGFQQCCTFADPLPDKLVFSLQTKYMVESDFANRSVESLRREKWDFTRFLLAFLKSPAGTRSARYPVNRAARSNWVCRLPFRRRERPFTCIEQPNRDH